MMYSKSIKIQKNHEVTLPFSIVEKINNWMVANQENAIGISVILIIAGTMIASISAALAVHEKIAYLPLIFTCISAMGANAVAISQRPFKYIIYAFAINILGNIALIIMQLIQLSA